MKTIRIDDEVWTVLKKHAQPLEDTPNSVLRRVLSLDSVNGQRKDRPAKSRTKPGIVVEIKHILRNASKSHPVNRDDIVGKLKVKFPGRDPLAMKRTVNGQISYHLKELIKGNPQIGYWLESDTEAR